MIIPGDERAAADSAYVYGIPCLIVVGVVLLITLWALLPALTRALLDVAAAGRVMGAAMGLRSEWERAEASRAGEERAAILAETRALRVDIADVKATVVARL